MPVPWSCIDNPLLLSHTFALSATPSKLFSSEPEQKFRFAHTKPAKRTLEKPKHSYAIIGGEGAPASFAIPSIALTALSPAYECCFSRAAVGRRFNLDYLLTNISKICQSILDSRKSGAFPITTSSVTSITSQSFFLYSFTKLCSLSKIISFPYHGLPD